MTVSEPVSETMNEPGSEPEAFEVLDAEGRPTGVTAPRDQVHAEGLWHAAVHVWILTPEGAVIVQRRSVKKDLAGGLIDVSVGGHLRPGETWLQGLREAEEELGLVLGPADVEHLGRYRSERRYPDGRLDREFQDEVVVVVDQPLEDYNLRCDEVQVIYEVPLVRAVALWRDGASVAAPGWDCQRRVNNALLIVDDLIEPARESTTAALERLVAWRAGTVGP
jgi:isopentenyl-diphosphate Delta-isomerase